MASDMKACPVCKRQVRCRKKDGRRSWHRGQVRKWCEGAAAGYKPRRPVVVHTPVLESEI